ncbi:MAG: hypothetical protein CL609_18805 [Anaerolineaceae bacterium]|nr:hypothetical protein [Anaerolineaceae bacterium]
MNDITLNLLVIAGFVVVGGVVLIVVFQKQKQNDKKLADFAKQKGWHLEKIRKPLEKGVRVTTPHWVLESIKRTSGVESGPGSSEWEQNTIWKTNQGGSLVWVGYKMSQVDLGYSGEMLMKQVFAAALGDEAKNLNQVHFGSHDFQKNYMVFAQDETEADRFITPAVQSALLSWQGVKPVIKRTEREITLELNGVFMNKPEKILSLIQLAERLL